MLIPFHKLMTLGVRVFSRPLIEYTKLYQKSNKKKSQRMKHFFIWFGNAQHHIETKINKSYQMQKLPAELNEEMATERGIEFFYEVIFYTVIFSIPLIEIFRMAREKRRSKDKFDTQTENVLLGIQEMKSSQPEINNQILQMKDMNFKIKDQLQILRGLYTEE